MRKYLFYNDQPEGDDDDPHTDCGQKTEEIINSEEDGQEDVQRAKEYPRDAGKALQQYMYIVQGSFNSKHNNFPQY